MKGTKKYTDFTKQDICDYLNNFKEKIRQRKYIISKNREKNYKFIQDYKINTNKEKEILLSIQYQDFCYAIGNIKEEFSHEILYVFCKCVELDNWGSFEKIDVFIKINMTQTRSGQDFVIVVSFHEPEESVEYLFDECF